MKTLLAVYENLTGHPARRESANSFCGPCPFCGGNDRFVIRPEDGRWFCRGCSPKGGDVESLLMRKNNISFAEACRLTGRPHRTTVKSYQKRFTASRGKTNDSKPRETIKQNRTWQGKAAKLVEYAESQLWGPDGQEALAYLKTRGLIDVTIQTARLGFIPKDLFRDREKWGLPPKRNANGRPKKIWIPAGLVIPCHDLFGRVIRVRFRRMTNDNLPRYIVLSGSDMRPMVLGDGLAWVIVESELDALLINQVAGDLVDAIALGSAQARPDQITAEIIQNSETILLALDSDEAGGKESWNWWRAHFPKAVRWPVPTEKDPGDFYKAGGDLRLWIRAGLPGQSDDATRVPGANWGIDPDVSFELRKIIPAELCQAMDLAAEIIPGIKLVGFEPDTQEF